jgi:radical SAM protein with 4Fe4S-binding SPASM domain
LEQADFILANVKECADELEAEPYILITGGDPFENPNFLEILERSLKVSSRVGILGNPEPIIKNNGEVIKRLVELKIDSYQVSLDGMEATHDAWRKEGSFKQTLIAIEMLRKAGIWTNVMSTVSAENYKEMPDVIRSSYAHGANFWTFTRYAPTIGGHCGIEPGEYLNFMEGIVEVLKPYEAQGKPTQTREPLLCQAKNFENHEKLGGCGMGFSRLVLLPDNTVMACRRHPGSVLGKVDHDHSLLWHFAMNEKMDCYRDFSLISECYKCKNVEKCRGCRAVAYLATGTEYGDDPQCLIAEKRRINAGISNDDYFIPQKECFSVKCS